MLFNIVADMLAILIARAKEDGQVDGLIPHLVDGGISILQYADDTIIFMDHNLEKDLNMKLVLCIFEQLSGLKINFHKSEILCFGKAKEVEDQYRDLFGCEAGSLPFRYLGIPIHYRKLTNGEWKSVEDRFEKKLSCWIGKLLSYGDRLVLINSVLTSLPMFMLSFFEIPKGVCKRLDFFRSRFFWQFDNHKRKYRLTKWSIICRPKDQGGLGVEVLELKNKCLLSKWLFKLLNEEGVWQELIQNKYLHSKTLSQVKAKPNDSPFWKGLLKVKDDFFSKGSFELGNGLDTRFWEDCWLGDRPLAEQYPSLYRIVQHKDVLVANVLQGSHLNIAFRRNLDEYKWTRWMHLVGRLIEVNLTDTKDNFVWNLMTSKEFTVKSMYLDYMTGHTRYLRKYIWKIKVPLKIRIFMWFLHRKVILTKDNLARRNWQGPKTCCFCDQDETIQHLFFQCPFAKVIWRIVHMAFGVSAPKNITNIFGNWLQGVDKRVKSQLRVGISALLWAMWHVRNDLTFNKTKNVSFLQVIALATHWTRSWLCLQPVAQRQDMDFGCNRLETVARDLFSRCGWQLDRRLTC
jgi:mannosylglycoprotein endo-beta-mannosidase